VLEIMLTSAFERQILSNILEGFKIHIALSNTRGLLIISDRCVPHCSCGIKRFLSPIVVPRPCVLYV